jgi:hypothetical protein
MIRKSMTSHLQEILCSERLSKKGFQDHFSNELLDLLHDSDLLVTLDAMRAALCVQEKKYLLEVQFQNDLIPAFLRLL